MSGIGGPETNGYEDVNRLLFCFDANNIYSFSPAGGNINWYNLVNTAALGPAGKVAQMYGTPDFVYDTISPVSHFNFSNVSGSGSSTADMGFTFATNPIPTSGPFTLGCWIKKPPSNAGQTTLFSNAGGADGYRFGIGINGVYFLIGGVGGTGYTEGQIAFLNNLSNSEWYYVVLIFDRDALMMRLFLNGVGQGTAPLPAPQVAFSNTVPGIVRNPCCQLWTGLLSYFHAFNYALTEQEIQYNYLQRKSIYRRAIGQV